MYENSESLKVVNCGKDKNLNKIIKRLTHLPEISQTLIVVILYRLQCKIEGHAV